MQDDTLQVAGVQAIDGQRYSPCYGCPHLYTDKEFCSIGCERLAKWQRKENYNVSDQVFFFNMARIQTHCRHCGAALLVEDGVTFCGSCMRVVTRLSNSDLRKRVRQLAKEGYRRKIIAALTGFSVSKCRKICMEPGLSTCFD